MLGPRRALAALLLLAVPLNAQTRRAAAPSPLPSIAAFASGPEAVPLFAAPAPAAAPLSAAAFFPPATAPAPLAASSQEAVRASGLPGGPPTLARAVQGPASTVEKILRADAPPTADLATRFFDQSGSRGPPSAVAAVLRTPAGIRSVLHQTVRTAADVERLIPDNSNSYHLKNALKDAVPRTAPYEIYTYRDSKGGSFVGIDLSASPALADALPDLEPHEIRLLKRLQLVDGDIRVLVREGGMTPDLVVGGRLVEVKSMLSDYSLVEPADRKILYNLSKPIDKANRQIREHAQRHGLGHGALILDYPERPSVPEEETLKLLNFWRSRAGDVALDYVLVFDQSGIKVFARRDDGAYERSPASPQSVFSPR